MSYASHISLLDLTKQFPFEIDDAVKQEICFAETLLISCGHYESEDVIDEDLSDSEWSCRSSTNTVSEEVLNDKAFEIKDRVEEEAVHEEEPENDDDFHYFFFPDCTKPQTSKDSKASVIMVDGLPKINPAAIAEKICTCGIDKKGKCECHTKLPCSCGAKTAIECTCKNLQEVCICHDGYPSPVCICKGSKVCVCHPDGSPQPICECEKIEKPCVCYPDKFGSPVCTCKEKPTFILDDIKSECSIESEMTGEEQTYFEEKKHVPCECQKPEPKRCLCLRGKDCICKEDACICGVQKTCVCEPEENEVVQCKSEDSKTICSCDVPKLCTCQMQSPDDCKCFQKNVHCTCGNPENCKCFSVCECTVPCVCDVVKTKDICLCFNRSKQDTGDLECTCPADDKSTVKKLKKVRDGKHGYRWCHEVDPRHTFFDYGYGRHGKISYKEQEREKIKILGLYDEKEEEEACAVHGIKAPPYKKRVRKPSLDCCSTVGGMSISVECLGEDKDRFLVQVVSHSSKEGAKTGTKLVSILDCNLHTMEENRLEHITKKDLTKERRSYMAICESGYYNKVTRICGERNVVKRFYHSFEDAAHFLLEGANVVLLRYFGLRRHRGNVKTESVLMDGVVCESIYVCHGVSQAIVNGKPLFVCKVERHIIEPSGVLHQTLVVLSLRGYIVSHEWANNSYIIHLNPLLRIVPEKDEIEPHVPLRENWREDLQLLSDYLDFKSTRSAEGARYVSESGALTNTVRDYLQALLMLRPHDALHFTRHYFGASLSALDLPHDEYFDPCAKHVRYFFFED